MSPFPCSHTHIYVPFLPSHKLYRYAYCMAAAHLNLKHFKIDNLMVSNVDAGGEGWPWVDKFSKSNSCDKYREGELAYAVSTELDKNKQIYSGDLPSVLHFCQVRILCSLYPYHLLCYPCSLSSFPRLVSVLLYMYVFSPCPYIYITPYCIRITDKANGCSRRDAFLRPVESPGPSRTACWHVIILC